MQFSKEVLASLFTATVVSAVPANYHKHHLHQKRADTCSFPTDLGLVEITPDSSNAGWAMSPDQSCTPGTWCPYACPPGQLMAQWDPKATSYSYPESQNGGLYCNTDGTLSKGDSSKDYCYDGKKTASVKNSASKDVAFCQTVLPGNENMLIPTNVNSSSTQVLAVPGVDYWAETAAHYYINAPGVSTDDGCAWGSTANPYGNWAPYVAGANMDDSENTFVKIAWNPIYLASDSPFKDTKPTFGVKMYCNDDSKCNGDPCTIDPSKYGINEINGGSDVGTSLGAAYCVLTATDSSSVAIEVFDV